MSVETAGNGWVLVLGFVLGAAATYGWSRWHGTRYRMANDVAMGMIQMQVARLEQAKHAWEQFASHAVPLMPVLARQLTTVIEQTECAAVDLTGRIRSISARARRQAADMSRPAGSGRSVEQARADAEELAADVSRIVMAMQFQDTTKQKLEHVAQPLVQMKTYMESLLANPTAPELSTALNLLEEVERSYTMETERVAMAHALQGHAPAGTPAKATVEEEEQGVTLF